MNFIICKKYLVSLSLSVLILSSLNSMDSFADNSATSSVIPSSELDTLCPIELNKLPEGIEIPSINFRKPCLGLFVNLNSDGKQDLIIVTRNLSIGRDSHGKSAESDILFYIQGDENKYSLVKNQSDDPLNTVSGHVDGIFYLKNENDSKTLFITARRGRMMTRFQGGLFKVEIADNGNINSILELLEIEPQVEGDRGESEHIKSETFRINKTTSGNSAIEYHTSENKTCIRLSSENYLKRYCN